NPQRFQLSNMFVTCDRIAAGPPRHDELRHRQALCRCPALRMNRELDRVACHVLLPLPLRRHKYGHSIGLTNSQFRYNLYMLASAPATEILLPRRPVTRAECSETRGRRCHADWASPVFAEFTAGPVKLDPVAQLGLRRPGPSRIDDEARHP